MRSRRQKVRSCITSLPTGASTERIGELIRDRKSPQDNPFTFLTCTDDDAQAEWMKEIEEKALWCAELDDFGDEREEVLKDQGAAFPFSYGLWILCNLVAAINPNDLDAIDESYPFSKSTLDNLDNLLGRKVTDTEYRHYFDSHPGARTYAGSFSKLATEPRFAKEILGIRN
jgi:hypothetical protein